MKSILDRSFRYVPSHATDLRKTFERIRKEGEAAQRPQPPAAVVPLNREAAATRALSRAPERARRD